MKNPYKILKLDQNATKTEIVKALPLALRENIKSKEYTNSELMAAQKQLLTPSKRLTADFIFPAKYKTKRPMKLNVVVEFSDVNLDTINEDNFNSLNNY